MDQLSLKVLYLRSLLLLDEIKYYDVQLRVDPINRLRLIRLCFIPLNIFSESLKHYNHWLVGKDELIKDKREISKNLEFVKHIRHKISGHLDDDVLSKASEWAPYIFSENLQKNSEVQLLLCYKSVIESAINSFLDDNGKQKNFGTEIDLFYPPNSDQFLNYLEKTNTGCIRFLEKIASYLNKEIYYHTDEEGLALAFQAGNVDFKLRK